MLECVKPCLFVNKLLIPILYYDAPDLFYRAEWLARTDILAKLRSRKGSVKTIVQFVAELLPRGGIFNEKRRGKTELNIFTESLVVTTQRHRSVGA